MEQVNAWFLGMATLFSMVVIASLLFNFRESIKIVSVILSIIVGILFVPFLVGSLVNYLMRLK